jgi:uncharacterized protein (TIGR04255 family)
MQRRQYWNPPIEEAVCEFRFLPDPDQDFAAPARFYETIRKDYPSKPEFQPLPPSEPTVEGKPAGVQVAFRGQSGKILFRNDTRTHLVGLASNLLSVHVLSPYPGWESFRPKIVQAIDAYIAAVGPKGLNRIGFRYINKIEVGQDDVPIAKLLTVSPLMPETISLDKASFFVRVEAAYRDRPARLAVNVASIEPSKPGGAAMLLDLEVYQDWPSEQPLPIAESMAAIDDFRVRERNAFEAYVTDDARKIFDAD